MKLHRVHEMLFIAALGVCRLVSSQPEEEDLSIYAKPPDEIDNSELVEAFSLYPPANFTPVNRRRMSPPTNDVSIPHEGWEFLGTLGELTSEEKAEVDAKRKLRNLYLETAFQTTENEYDAAALHDFQKRISEQLADEIPESILNAKGIAITREGAVYAVQSDLNTVSLHNASDGNSITSLPTNEDVGGEMGEDLDRRNLLIPATAVQPHPRSSITGDDMTEYPWTAQGCFSPTTNPHHCFCSGTKVSARVVLTLAECVFDHAEGHRRIFFLPGADGLAAPHAYYLTPTTQNNLTPNGAQRVQVSYIPPTWYAYGWGYTVGVAILSPTQENCDLGWLSYDYIPALEVRYKPVFNMYGYPTTTFECVHSPIVTYRHFGPPQSTRTTRHQFCYDSLYGTAGNFIGSDCNPHPAVQAGELLEWAGSLSIRNPEDDVERHRTELRGLKEEYSYLFHNIWTSWMEGGGMYLYYFLSHHRTVVGVSVEPPYLFTEFGCFFGIHLTVDMVLFLDIARAFFPDSSACA